MKFIKLTTRHRPVYINVNSIEVVMPNTDTNGSSIFLYSGKPGHALEVSESFDKVINEINET